MEIIQERLEREFGMTVITTVPSVKFHAIGTDGTIIPVSAPSEMPEVTKFLRGGAFYQLKLFKI